MKKWTGFLMAGILVLGIAGSVMAQSDNHQVTVQVSAISVLEINPKDDPLVIQITTADPGSEPTAVVNTDDGLEWTTNESNKKITVQTNAVYSTFSLAVQATGVSGGSGAGSVDLTVDTNPHDFVTGISQTVGSCTLSYTASATASDGTGSETHTITYTITDV